MDGGAAVYTGSFGLTYYRHADWLSTLGFGSLPNQTLDYDVAAAPFGKAEQGTFAFGEAWYRNNTTTKWLFTTYQRDSDPGLDYPMARYYDSRLGRFMSADPMGLGSAEASDPQSLNAYAYVRNSPTGLTDPTGMDDLCQWVDSTVNGTTGQETITGYETGGCCPPGETESATVAVLGGQWSLCVGNEDNQIWQEAFDINNGMNQLYNCLAFGFCGANGGGSGGPSGPTFKQALGQILKNPQCASLLGGEDKAMQALGHFNGLVNVDASGYSGPSTPRQLIDSPNGPWAVTPVPQTPGGNFSNGKWSGPNFSTYVGSAFLGMSQSQQLTVEMHEFIHATSPGDIYSQGLVDLSNMYGQKMNIFDIAKDCGTALPPGYGPVK